MGESKSNLIQWELAKLWGSKSFCLGLPIIMRTNLIKFAYTWGKTNLHSIVEIAVKTRSHQQSTAILTGSGLVLPASLWSQSQIWTWLLRHGCILLTGDAQWSIPEPITNFLEQLPLHTETFLAQSSKGSKLDYEEKIFSNRQYLCQGGSVKEGASRRELSSLLSL